MSLQFTRPPACSVDAKLTKRLGSWGALLLVALTGCGVSDKNAGALSNPLRLAELRLNIDDEPYAVYADFTKPIVIDADNIIVGATRLSFELTLLNNSDVSPSCTLGGTPLAVSSNESLKGIIQAAYLTEEMLLTCVAGNHTPISQLVTIRARDPQLEAALVLYLDNVIRTKDNVHPNDPYSGYRVKSYYNEIQRFIMAAEIYARPDIFNVDSNLPLRNKVEDYLINSSEAFFEPCPDYDFESGALSQCRSPARIGKYYLWRSPLNSESLVRMTHGKAEWRAAGGIAQAIKAILLQHGAEASRDCAVSDKPSELSGASLYCRALNVRRLLYREIWQKWSDEEWVSSLGYSYEFTIQGADVSHYIAWTELMVDLFHRTAEIGIDSNCSGCGEFGSVPSRKDDLINNFFFEQGVGHISVSCKSPLLLTGCNFLGNEFQITQAGDLSHLSAVIHLVSMYDQQEICTSDRGKCVAIDELARTMNEQTWIESTPDDGLAVGFPKFDLFFNGYCNQAASNEADPLHDFCIINWYSETGGWPSHKNLFGYVNLGKHDRNLMLKLRQAADENHDGFLDKEDSFLQMFSVTLYSAIHGRYL